ncbi:YadA-like family protein [Mannheimia pernigra]|uniref:YadA-like family protein n=1 Tax=Mannheimia pernigra TaxID=111844 RepID=A0ABD7A6Z1_9PAST|nr:YadA-like family protein [Mannheimia pernigra]QLB41789.1 YadA-like family protein [Mannheimia pernigra]
MNKIFKVKKNALGQSVACSELATSRSKSRVVATALALAVASGVSMADDTVIEYKIDGTQFNNLYKAVKGQDLGLQGMRDARMTLNEFGQFTADTLIQLGSTTYSLIGDVDALTKTVISNKIDTVHNKADIDVTARYVNGLKDIVNNNATDIAENKAYLDSIAESVLANKVASTTNKADIAENKKNIAANKEHVDVLTDTVLANKVDIAHNKADIDATARYVNGLKDIVNDNAIEVAKIGGLQAQITANQADSAKNFTDTNANIKANKDALETKVEKRDFYHVQDNVNSNNTEIAKLQANKADVEYVDNVAEGVLANKVASATNKADIAENKAYLDSVAEGALANKVASTTNKADIAKNKKDIAANKEHVDVLTDTVIANKVDIVHNKAKIHMLETSVNSFQNQTLDLTSTKTRVSALENRTSALETRVNKLNKNLSAGIAGTAALSMMPTAGEKGAHYITAGAGHYNGQQAIAIGLTGNSNSGKFNYKVGASATTSGSPVVGAGVGYRWK